MQLLSQKQVDTCIYSFWKHPKSVFPTKLFLKNWQEEIKLHCSLCLSYLVKKQQSPVCAETHAGGFNECIKIWAALVFLKKQQQQQKLFLFLELVWLKSVICFSKVDFFFHRINVILCWYISITNMGKCALVIFGLMVLVLLFQLGQRISSAKVVDKSHINGLLMTGQVHEQTDWP